MFIKKKQQKREKEGDGERVIKGSCLSLAHNRLAFHARHLVLFYFLFFIFLINGCACHIIKRINAPISARTHDLLVLTFLIN